MRLVTAVIAEAHDEWQVTERRYLSEGSMNKLNDIQPPPALPPHDTHAKIAS
jgi:putative transposase